MNNTKTAPAAVLADPETKRPETISASAAPAAVLADPETSAPAEPSAPAVKFTTRAMIINGTRHKVRYHLTDAGALEISGELENGKPFIITLPPDHDHYPAARAAYDEKAAKRAKYDAEPRETLEKSFVGIEMKGPGWIIKMDGSINRATVTFKRKPDPATRELVKAAGFYWSPVHKQWSRGLTHKAWRAAQELYSQLRSGKRPETISA